MNNDNSYFVVSDLKTLLVGTGNLKFKVCYYILNIYWNFGMQCFRQKSILTTLQIGNKLL